MKPATLEFLRQRFFAYYNGAIPGAGAGYTPESLTEREWGFLFFTENQRSGMRRHISFTSPEELTSYLKSMVPAHVYYSTAYYTHPGAAQMADKEWRGADVIFDLDADHIVRGPYDIMLARVKEELFKLIEMLTGELGFAKRDLRINFSGGRGYHVHLPLLSVRGWDTAERRELVNYVSGTGLSFDSMMAPPQKTGWKLRYHDALEDELTRIAGLPYEDALSYLSGLSGISEMFAAGFIKNISQTQNMLRSNPEKLLANKVVRAIANSENEPFQAGILSRAAQADEPVTTDVKRLIRHPGSLHGGSGMRVVPIPIDQLDAFDPLIDAVVFGERNVSVDCAFNLSMPILGNTYTLTAGRNIVPEALGVFLCCRGIAELSGGT